MKLRTMGLISTLALALLCPGPIPAEAQQPEKVYRIGVLMSASAETTEPFVDALRKGLRELGYVEGENFVLDVRFGEAKRDRLSKLASELVRLKVDVIIAGGGAAINAGKKATRVIPIVMRTTGDPVRRGYVASLARPGGNITGFTSIARRLASKRLELIREIVPQAKKIAFLTPSRCSRAACKQRRKKLADAARALGLKLVILEAQDLREIEEAFSTITKERADALMVRSSGHYVKNRARILNLAVTNRLPSIYYDSVYVEKGGLLSYGANFVADYRRVVTFVDRILKGAKPADLPVEQATAYELAINLTTAKQLGITIPPSILYRADKVIR